MLTSLANRFAELPQWLQLALTLAGLLMASFIVVPVLVAVLRRLARRTRTPIDEILLRAVATPLRILVFALGARIALDAFELPASAAIWGGHLTLVLGIGAVAFAVDRGTHELIGAYVGTSDFLHSSAGLLRLLARVAVYSLALLVLLGSMGISITPLVASLGVGSLAVALALQPSLQQMFAGLYLVMDRPIRVGDFVRIENGDEGQVEAIGWRTVRIRVLQDNVVIVPNDRMASSIIFNYSQPGPESLVLLQVGVAYNSDLDRVEAIALEAARSIAAETGLTDEAHGARVRFDSFGDSAIQVTVVVRARDVLDRIEIRSALLRRLHSRFRAEGIDIPFPIRTVHLRDGPARPPSSSP